MILLCCMWNWNYSGLYLRECLKCGRRQQQKGWCDVVEWFDISKDTYERILKKEAEESEINRLQLIVCSRDRDKKEERD